jgi:Flp pilus assembly pilin Flp
MRRRLFGGRLRLQQTVRSGPAGNSPHLEGSRRGAEQPNFTNQAHDAPDHAKGGEPVLKLFTFAQTADALRGEEGQTMAEYGVVLAVITLAVIAAISLLSGNVQNALENVAGLLPG